jgi:hypothetical protein
MLISGPNPSALIGDDYLMVKNDSVPISRNAVYIPYDSDEWNSTSGSSYDSNFMAFKANVQYILQVSTTIEKAEHEPSASLEFYITSSVASIKTAPTFTSKYGLKIATISSNEVGVVTKHFDDQIFFLTPFEDIYGTLVIVPSRCQAYLKSVSFRVYGDDGFSPDSYTTRIPWSVATAGESFEIKAELFDINQNLVYSDLRVLAQFDPSGSSLIPYIPGGGTAGDLFVQGNLTVSKSIDVQKGSILIEQGQLSIPNIGIRPGAPPMSASRFLSIRHDNVGQIVENPVVDIDGDDSYLYLSLGPLPGVTPPVANVISTYRSISTIFDANSGRRIYYSGECIGANKIVQSGSYS